MPKKKNREKKADNLKKSLFEIENLLNRAFEEVNDPAERRGLKHFLEKTQNLIKAFEAVNWDKKKFYQHLVHEREYISLDLLVLGKKSDLIP